MDRIWGLRKFGKQRAIALGSSVIYAVYDTWRNRQTDGWTRQQVSRDTRQENHQRALRIGPRVPEGRPEIEGVKMREISLVLSILGTLVLFFCASTTFDSRKYDRLERSISRLAKVAGDWNASKYSRSTALTIALKPIALRSSPVICSADEPPRVRRRSDYG